MDYLQTLPVFPYVLSVVLATWLTLFFLKPTKQSKVIIPFVWGVLLGIVWLKCVQPPIDLLILAFFSSAGLYDYIIKWIFEFFNINHKTVKPNKYE